jgi:hypothetical protein
MAISSLCNALLTDVDIHVRGNAAISLGQIGDEMAIPFLIEAMDNEKKVEVRRKVVEALGKIGGDCSVSENRTINTGGGNYYESIETSGGQYIQGNYIEMSQDLTDAAADIQRLIEQLQKSGSTVNDAQEQVAKDMKAQAQNNPTIRKKLMQWGQSIGESTITDVVKGTIKIAIRSAGLPLP